MWNSLRNKLLVAFALNLMLLLILGGVALAQMAQMNATTQTITTEVIPALNRIGQITSIITEYHNLQSDHISALPSDKPGLEDTMHAREAEMALALPQFVPFAETTHERTALADLEQQWTTLVQGTHQDLLPKSSANNSVAALAALHALDSTYTTLLATARDLTQVHDQQATLAAQTASDAYNTARVLALVITAIALVTAALIGFILSTRLVRNIRQLTLASAAVAAGDLEHSVVVESQDELGTLATTFNQMTTALQSARQAVQTSQQGLAERTAELEHSLAALQAALAERDALTTVVRQMENPVIPILDGIVVMPLIGTIDSARAALMLEELPHAIERHHARVVIIDLTGVPLVDSQVAQALLQAGHVSQLLGSTAMFVGLRPELAQTIVGLGLDVSGLIIRSNLQYAVRDAIQRFSTNQHALPDDRNQPPGLFRKLLGERNERQ